MSANPKASGKVASIRAKLKFPTEDVFIQKYAPNLSQMGIFIKTPKPKDVGTPVRFEFQIADGTPVMRGAGEVAWTRAVGEDGRPGGMGIRFLKLDAKSKQVLERVLEWKAKTGKASPSRFSMAPPPAAEEEAEPQPETAAEATPEPDAEAGTPEPEAEEGAPEPDAEASTAEPEAKRPRGRAGRKRRTRSKSKDIDLGDVDNMLADLSGDAGGGAKRKRRRRRRTSLAPSAAETGEAQSEIAATPEVEPEPEVEEPVADAAEPEVEEPAVEAAEPEAAGPEVEADFPEVELDGDVGEIVGDDEPLVEVEPEETDLDDLLADNSGVVELDPDELDTEEDAGGVVSFIPDPPQPDESVDEDLESVLDAPAEPSQPEIDPSLFDDTGQVRIADAEEAASGDEIDPVDALIDEITRDSIDPEPTEPLLDNNRALDEALDDIFEEPGAGVEEPEAEPAEEAPAEAAPDTLPDDAVPPGLVRDRASESPEAPVEEAPAEEPPAEEDQPKKKKGFFKKLFGG